MAAVTSKPRRKQSSINGSEVALLQEKIAAAAAAGRINFFPPLDNYTEETAEHRRAYPVMLRSPVVKAAILQKIFAVASLDLQVTSASSEARDREIAEFVRYAYTVAFGHTDKTGDLDVAATNGELVKMAETVLLHGLMRGQSICGKVWYESPWERGRWKGKRFLRDLKAKEYAALEQDEFRNITGVFSLMWGDDRNVVYSPRDFVIFRFLPLYEGQGMSEFRAVYGYWQRLDTILNIWIVHLEKFLSPHLIAKYANPDDLDALQVEIAQAKSRHYTIVPDDVIVEALQLASRGEAEMEKACRFYEEKIVLGITGAFLQMLTAGASGDIRGDSQTQKNTAELLVWHLAAVFTSILNKQVTPDLVNLNYLDADYPLCSLGGVNWSELKNAIEIEKRAQEMGFKLSRKAFAAKYSLQEAEEPGDELVPLPTSPLPGMPGLFATRQPVTPTEVEVRPEVAAAGQDVDAVEDLLTASKAEGIRILAAAAKAALKRLLAKGPKALLSAKTFFGKELADVAEQFVKTNGTAELLGRSRVRLRKARSDLAHGARTFSSHEPTGFHVFADIRPFGPREAIEYFKNLIPTLNVDVERFGRILERKAFTLAGATDRWLLNAVQDLIRLQLKTGEIGRTDQAIDEVLADLGVSPRNPQYAEMVYRTNMMDAYNIGVSKEIAELEETFPVWEYANPDDARSRPHHADRNGNYYPASKSFMEVRGTDIADVANCRCTPIPIDRYEWAELQKRGAKVTTGG